MSHLRTGDRVQLIGDIARYYPCILGIVEGEAASEASVLNQYRVRLADGTVARFFDFQLEIPPVIQARIVLDSLVSENRDDSRDAARVRCLRLVARDVDIHLKISGSPEKTILGQLTAGPGIKMRGLVMLMAADQILTDAFTYDSGEFILNDVSSGDLTIEILMPSRRVVSSLKL